LFVSCSAPVFNQIAVVECLDNNNNWIIQENEFSSANLEFKVILVDFDNQIKRIRISSTSKMFDPIELNVKFVFADKEAYYAKVRAQEEAKRVEAQNALNAKINPACKTGDSLVNIYWDNANESVEYSVINLYSVFDRTTNRLIGKYKEAGGLFKSINGLAYGEYFYEIIQFDSNGNKVAWTELIKFSLGKYTRGYTGAEPLHM